MTRSLTADEMIRRLFPANPTTAPSSKMVVLATIEVIGAFEAFHHYENWGQGYRITAQGIVVEAEGLDEALTKWSRAKGRKEA